MCLLLWEAKCSTASKDIRQQPFCVTKPYILPGLLQIRNLYSKTVNVGENRSHSLLIKIKQPQWASGDLSGKDNLQLWQQQKVVTALVHMHVSVQEDCTKTPDMRKPAESGRALDCRQG